MFRQAPIILIPFPPSTHPPDPLPFFLLAWTLICAEKNDDTPVFDRKRVPVWWDWMSCQRAVKREPCGGLYGPSDVENRETDPLLTTALCIQTHPRRGALPAMATCPVHSQTQNTNALSVNRRTHTYSTLRYHTSLSDTRDHWASPAETPHLCHCTALEGQMSIITMASKSK